ESGRGGLRLRTLAVGAGLALAALFPASAFASTVTASIDEHGLRVIGDGTGNGVTVDRVDDPGCPGGPPCYEISSADAVVSATVPCVVAATGPPLWKVWCPGAGIERLTMLGREGDDNLHFEEFSELGSLAVPATIEGGTGDDYLYGGPLADVLEGDDGADYLYRSGAGHRRR